MMLGVEIIHQRGEQQVLAWDTVSKNHIYGIYHISYRKKYWTSVDYIGLEWIGLDWKGVENKGLMDYFELIDGVANGTRTHDNRDHNPGLYQLSYSHHNKRGSLEPRRF